MTSIEIKSPEEFQAHINGEELVYVDYWKDNCPNCKMLDLSFAEFKNSEIASKVKVLKVKLEEMGENFFLTVMYNKRQHLYFTKAAKRSTV